MDTSGSNAPPAVTHANDSSDLSDLRALRGALQALRDHWLALAQQHLEAAKICHDLTGLAQAHVFETCAAEVDALLSGPKGSEAQIGAKKDQ